MSAKFQCDRCGRLFDSSQDVTEINLGDVPHDLCEADLRDLRYFVKEKVVRDQHGNEIASGESE